METKAWKWFRLGELFLIETGGDLIYSELKAGEYNVIGHKAENNGVTATTQFLNTYRLYDCNKTIALGDRGNFFASIQTSDFYIGTRVKALVSKNSTNKYILLFICTLINAEQYRFSYGRNCCDRTSDLAIKLPITENGTPDWEWMENYVKNNLVAQLPEKTKAVWENNFDTTPFSSQKLELHPETWQWFRYDEIFEITGSATTPKIELESYGKGEFPYVTTQAVNNGIECFYNFSTEKGNVLTVDSAVLGFCSYQEKDFSASDHVEKLIPKFDCNIFVAMFLTTIINREQYRYNYGRKCSQTKLRQSKIKLPVTENGTPDWQFMEDYIKSLPYSGCL